LDKNNHTGIEDRSGGVKL